MNLSTQPEGQMELLRFTTAGSVDDGKSTLIGRLLVESKGVYEDQYESVRKVSEDRGQQKVDLALITDGLKSEREQGITIDVAYRYFSTPKRSFIIADTPGHEQYTRNMVTGASTAQLAVLLVDARKGIITQTKRHLLIASLLGIPRVLVAVNKMDLVDYSQEVYDQILKDFRAWAVKLSFRDVRFIPISALNGDMVTERGDNLGWYSGRTFLEILENIEVFGDQNFLDFRFPVQWVSRPQTEELHDFRGYMGRVESGSVDVGDEIVVLPTGLTSKVKSIVTYDGELQSAGTPLSICLTLEDELDISRGDMIVRPGNVPRIDSEFEAAICWMNQKPLDLEKKYLIKHTTRTLQAKILELRYRIDVNTLHRDNTATELNCNEIGRVLIKTQKPLFVDSYSQNRVTGSFIMVDEHSNDTVAGGMIWKKSYPPPKVEEN